MRRAFQALRCNVDVDVDVDVDVVEELEFLTMTTPTLRRNQSSANMTTSLRQLTMILGLTLLPWLTHRQQMILLCWLVFLLWLRFPVLRLR
jgi:hypothetical protein